MSFKLVTLKTVIRMSLNYLVASRFSPDTIETLADATTDAEAQARVNTIRDTAQAVNCETNRSG